MEMNRYRGAFSPGLILNAFLIHVVRISHLFHHFFTPLYMKEMQVLGLDIFFPKSLSNIFIA